jgi:NTE family protein
MVKKAPRTPRIGLALAGGGPLGAIYEIGALCAIDESLDGLHLNELHGYIGVSAGGFIAAALANGMSPRELCASFIENAGDKADIFEPALLVRPAWGHWAKRLALVPAALTQAAFGYVFKRRSLSAVLEQLGKVLPTGVFANDVIEAQMRRQFMAPGRTNDFRQLRRKLVLVATNLDSGESTPFGQPGFDHVPISKAIQASAALPGLFPPVEIDGQHYVDGVLKKTLHASVLLDEGLDLLICLNPLVPFDATRSPSRRVLSQEGGGIPSLLDGGLPVVLSQTFRTMIHSRLELGMRGYERSHPDTTIVLFEPDQRDPAMFLANTFSYSQRHALAEHAYQQTRQVLRKRRVELAEKLAPHGITFNMAVLEEPERCLLGPQTRVPARRRSGRAVERLQNVLDELERSIPQRAKRRSARVARTLR